jgi:amino acid transporter
MTSDADGVVVAVVGSRIALGSTISGSSSLVARVVVVVVVVVVIFFVIVIVIFIARAPDARAPRAAPRAVTALARVAIRVAIAIVVVVVVVVARRVVTSRPRTRNTKNRFAPDDAVEAFRPRAVNVIER